MENEIELDGVPVSPLLSEHRKNGYGSVPGLPDEELASPEELELQVFLQEWGPILALPQRGRKCPITPNIDEYFGVDYGAFATVDFERSIPQFDRTRYKADKLQEELQDILIRLRVVKYRLTKAHLKVLKYLQMGVLDLEDIEDVDLHCTARLFLRALRLQKEIRQLRDVSWVRRKRELAEALR